MDGAQQLQAWNGLQLRQSSSDWCLSRDSLQAEDLQQLSSTRGGTAMPQAGCTERNSTKTASMAQMIRKAEAKLGHF